MPTKSQRDITAGKKAVAEFHAQQRKMPAMRRQRNQLKLQARQEKIEARRLAKAYI